jgi:hypothetical protein
MKDKKKYYKECKDVGMSYCLGGQGRGELANMSGEHKDFSINSIKKVA